MLKLVIFNENSNENSHAQSYLKKLLCECLTPQLILKKKFKKHDTEN